MKLVHYTACPLTKVKSVPRKMRGGRDGFGPGGIADKPRGFWVTDMDCENNWKSWCIAEDFSLHKLRYAQEVILSPRAKILGLKSAEDIKTFTKAYGRTMYPGSSVKLIDWGPVVREYQGIIITPYIWECRMDNDCFWYYSWDCAAGCIWDARAIKQLEMVVFFEQEGA